MMPEKVNENDSECDESLGISREQMQAVSRASQSLLRNGSIIEAEHTSPASTGATGAASDVVSVPGGAVVHNTTALNLKSSSTRLRARIIHFSPDHHHVVVVVVERRPPAVALSFHAADLHSTASIHHAANMPKLKTTSTRFRKPNIENEKHANDGPGQSPTSQNNGLLTAQDEETRRNFSEDTTLRSLATAGVPFTPTTATYSNSVVDIRRATRTRRNTIVFASLCLLISAIFLILVCIQYPQSPVKSPIQLTRKPPSQIDDNRKHA